jgi:pyruvate dehydrogenase E1 component alpha subunit
MAQTTAQKDGRKTRKAESESDLSPDQLIELYRQMVLIRRFEEKCQEMYTKAKIGGFLHLYIGEEATGVGAVSALRDGDHIFTHYRDHGHALARGLDPKALMAELRRCEQAFLGRLCDRRKPSADGGRRSAWRQDAEA